MHWSSHWDQKTSHDVLTLKSLALETQAPHRKSRVVVMKQSTYRNCKIGGWWVLYRHCSKSNIPRASTFNCKLPRIPWKDHLNNTVHYFINKNPTETKTFQQVWYKQKPASHLDCLAILYSIKQFLSRTPSPIISLPKIPPREDCGEIKPKGIWLMSFLPTLSQQWTSYLWCVWRAFDLTPYDIHSWIDLSTTAVLCFCHSVRAGRKEEEGGD